MIRGERLIKLGDSWFSTKSILVEIKYIFIEGRATLINYRIYKNFELRINNIF